MSASFKNLQKKIGYQFQDEFLLQQAMTHSSLGSSKNYERLEFLGDRVLGLIMARILFERFPEENEGGLSKRLAALVQGRTLASIAAIHEIGAYIQLSSAEHAAGGAENENILSDTLEALLGAVFLDGGLEPASKLVRAFWGANIDVMAEVPQDPKTELQEWAQAQSLPLPVYDIISRSGPDHAPVFEIEVKVQGYDTVRAEGPSRRQAEKTAARILLRNIKKGKI